MAQREIVIIGQYDSNLLGHIDLTDGTYNAVEHTHSSCVDSFHKVGNELYVAFEDNGARIAKYLGDGLFAPENEDIGVARINSGADSSSILANKRWPAGVGAFIKIGTNEWGDTSNWQIVDGQDNVIMAGDVNSFWGNNTIIYPEGYELAPGVAHVPGSEPVIQVTDDWASIRNFYLNGCSAFDGNELVQFINGQDGNVYEVRSSFVVDETVPTSFHATPTSSVLVMAGAVNNVMMLSNGNFALDNGTNTAWLWDGVTATAIIEMPDNIMQELRRARAQGDANAFAYSGGEIPWEERGITGQDMARISLTDLSKTIISMPAIAEIPAEPLYEARGLNVGFHNGIRIKAFRAFKTQAMVETVSGSLLIENYNTGTYAFYGDFSERMQTGRLCPLGELDDDDVTVISAQPYEVTGVVEKAGVKVATDLVLVDNESLAIVGRTKSDPVTGAYKFRCYTNNKKSVFARHPVSKGLRIAAEVVPVLVA